MNREVRDVVHYSLTFYSPKNVTLLIMKISCGYNWYTLIFNFHHTTDWILCPLLRVTWQSQSRENSRLSKQKWRQKGKWLMIMGKFTARIDGHGCLLSWNLMKWKHKTKKKKKNKCHPVKCTTPATINPHSLPVPRPMNHLVCLNVTFTLKSKQIQTGIHTV